MTYPKSIWIDRGPNGGWMFRTEKLHDSVREYVPVDALTTAHAETAALRAEVERLRNHADMLAQLLAKSCGDISALLIFGSREGDIRPWTAEYTQAINVHDAHFAPVQALKVQP